MLESNYSEIPSENPNKKKIIIFVLLGVIILIGVLSLIIFFMKKSGSSNSAVDIKTASPIENTSSSPAAQTVQIIDKFPNDKDRDGIDDQKEKELGTSNQDFDTDGDGLSDSDELDVWKTDPTKSDTDGDTFNDGYEVLNGYNPLGAGKL